MVVPHGPVQQTDHISETGHLDHPLVRIGGREAESVAHHQNGLALGGRRRHLDVEGGCFAHALDVLKRHQHRQDLAPLGPGLQQPNARDGRQIQALLGLDGERDPFEHRLLEGIQADSLEHGAHVLGHAGGVQIGDDVLDHNGRLAHQLDVALHGQALETLSPGVGIQGLRHGGGGQGGGGHRVVHDFEPEIQGASAANVQADAQGHHVGLGAQDARHA